MMLSLDMPSEIEGVADVCVIGAGPAGMTAAVYLARKKLSAAIVAKDVGGQMAWTLGIENYMGYQYVTGRELTAKFEEQVRQFPVPIVTDDVTGLSREGGEFKVVTAGGREIVARAVIVASGKRPRELGIPDERRFIGRGLSYCATCDGPLFAGKDVAVCGGGNSAIQAAIEMSKVASRVYVVSRSPWRADPIVQDRAAEAQNIVRKTGFEAIKIMGDRAVEGLVVRDKSTGSKETLGVQGVFVEIGLKPNTDFCKSLLDLNPYGEIKVNCRCETNMPGIFAAGDVTDVHEKQIVVAAGEGAKAALSAHEFLLRGSGPTRSGRDTW
jgi:alkyl hydroperoxide reductase subunit F